MGKGEIVVLFSFLIIFSIVSSSVASSEYNLIYDDNGNLIQSFDKYFEYNRFNQIKLVRENNSASRIIAEYFYDGEGNRIKKIENALDGENTTTYYVGKNFVQIINSSGVYNETYYYNEQDLIAEKDNSGNLKYYHPDHLGSTTLITNGSGEVVEETSYLPYGEPIEGGNSRYLFTGKEKDTNTELYYYGARYYDPFFKHFIQPDNVLPDIYDPQQLNRYSYVRNNPYKYTDPEGEWINMAIGGAVGGLVASGYALYNQVVLGEYMSARDVLSTVGAGVTSGAVFAGTFGLVSGALGATSTGGMILSGAGAGTFAGSLAGESGLITGSVLGGNLNNLANPIAHAEAVGYGGLTGGVLGLVGGVVGVGINSLRGSGVSNVNYKNLPSNVQKTIDQIQGGRTEHLRPHTYYNIPNSGEIRLPTKPQGYYMTHDIANEGKKGAQRIITGKSGEIYYTPQHYLKEGGVFRVDMTK